MAHQRRTPTATRAPRPTTQRPSRPSQPRVAPIAGGLPPRPIAPPTPWYASHLVPPARPVPARVQRTVNYRLVNVIKNAVIILMAMIICGLLATLAREATQLANERAKVVYVQVTPATGSPATSHR